MNAKFESSVDTIGMNILRELQINARYSFSEIGRKVGLSSPAVAERVYKMEGAKVISGYHADINPGAFGLDIMAFITLTTQPEKYEKIYAFAGKQKEIMECHHISGNESLIMKIVTGSISQLNSMVENLSKFGETKTSIVLSSPVRKKIMEFD
ncbi:MAG: AsnC family transcriptional regulator [Desulfobacterales bacterium RIFOXYA12_FULL_46_15]|nr:MAG: AsnC family transcriptional regulator [Desulfobacterales bacterium RIFOXYA12_FULL_46_15]